MSVRNARKRKTRRVNPYIVRTGRAAHSHRPHAIPVEGPCAYCRKRRAVNRDHVIPRSVLRTYNATAPDDAPSVPPEWLVEVASCFECNILKGRRRLVPPSWAKQVDELNRFFGGTPWRTWSGDIRDTAYRMAHT